MHFRLDVPLIDLTIVPMGLAQILEKLVQHLVYVSLTHLFVAQQLVAPLLETFVLFKVNWVAPVFCVPVVAVQMHSLNVLHQ